MTAIDVTATATRAAELSAALARDIARLEDIAAGLADSLPRRRGPDGAGGAGATAGLRLRMREATEARAMAAARRRKMSLSEFGRRAVAAATAACEACHAETGGRHCHACPGTPAAPRFLFPRGANGE